MTPENPRHCRHCGFSLEGVSYRTACPGCGAPVYETLWPHTPPIFNLPPPDAPPAGPVQTDDTCLTCGYALRGLDPAGACPECGSPVMQSLMGRFLRFAGVDYLRALHVGCKLVLWSLVGRGLILVVGFALSMISPEVARGGVMIVGMIAVGVSTYGWVLLTGEHEIVASMRSRSWARWLIIAANVVELLAYTSWAGQSPSMTGLATNVVPGGACFFTLGFLIVWVISITIGMVYLAGLARRMPDPKLASLCSMSSWLIPLLLVVGAIGPGIICPFTAPAGPVAAFVFYIVVMDRWRSASRQAHVQAVERAGGVDPLTAG